MSRKPWHRYLPPLLAILASAQTEPPIIEAVRNGNTQQLQDLLTHKDALNARGTQHQTALHEAAAKCDLPTARTLVQAGLDRTVQDAAGRSAAIIALNCPDASTKDQLVRLLFVPPHSPNTNGSAASRLTLQDATAHGDTAIVEMLLKLGTNVDSVDKNGNRALEIAARKGNARMAELLLNHHAGVKLRTAAGTSALHEAALGGDPKVIELLIQHGAIVDEPDQEKAATPLHYAASFGRLEAAKILLQHGADPHRKNQDGRDAATLAAENGHRELVDLLRTASPGR